jgi:hypothetical protein
MTLPIARLSKVSILCSNVRLNLFKYGKIGTMLIQYDDIYITFGFKTGDKVLANKTSAAGENYLFFHEKLPYEII